MLELAGIIILGILAQWVAWRIRLPAILPLILLGLLVGPISILITPEYGGKWIEPMYNPATGKGVFAGQSLFYFISLAIGIILFEGGLTLKRKEIRGVGPVILKLITVGSIVTFIGAGLAAHFIMNLTWQISFLFAALIIVTGPTVIAPILQNIPLNRNVSTVLKWEGILIDPIGALVAVLVFEFISSSSGHGEPFTAMALKHFFQVVLISLALGSIAAYSLFQLIKQNWIPHYLLNVFTLAYVLTIFVFSDLLAAESGILTVVVMGMVLGNLDVPQLKDILSFKESLSVLLISMLFILLAANINLEELELLLDWRCLVLFGIVILILRPLGVFLSTQRSELNLNEKAFISWVGPRGIVAAGIASLFGLKLSLEGVPQAQYITPLVFLIVLGTVLLNATTARFLAGWLKVIQRTSNGILFVGSNMASRAIARYLKDNGRHVVLIDQNPSSVKKAVEEGLEAFQANVYVDDLTEQFELVDVGYLIAMTSSAEVNEYAVDHFQNLFGEKGAFRLISAEEMHLEKDQLPERGLLSYADDYLNLNEAVRDFPDMHELPLSSLEELKAYVEEMAVELKSIPVFTKDMEGDLKFLPSDLDDIKMEDGLKLVYMGKKVETKEKGITDGTKN